MRQIFKFTKYLVTIIIINIILLSFSSCSKDFLDSDPLSFYEPTLTFSTEAGLQSVLAICDRQLMRYYTDGNSDVMLPIMSEYTFSDLMVPSGTDKTDLLDNVAQKLTPNSDQTVLVNVKRICNIWFFWQQTYAGICNANTVLTYINKVNNLDEETKNIYIGRAYFHRAFRYYLLVFEYNNVPLVTKVLDVPKHNFRSTSRDAILEMLVKDMEFAVKWVPDQSNMEYIGMVNKGACRMLLSKLYLATGEFQKAKEQLDIIIDNSGYSLMTEPFGEFINNYTASETWPITRNVIWDLHRPENKLISENKEVIMGLPDRGAESESFLKNYTMRALYPFYFNKTVKMPDGKQALIDIKRTDVSNYNPELDYMRALGRGISNCRPSSFYQNELWAIDGVMDTSDLRHSVRYGNWVTMESLKCNNKKSKYYGQNLRLYDDNGKLLCADTIRRWYSVPHYIWKMDDPVSEANVSGSNGNKGASDGSNSDWYLFRLAEAYLLRAEAKFYINPEDATIKDDLNIIRQRAHCSLLYKDNVTIGDIMDERARELFWEEFRNVELKRVSLCLAISGRPDEWGNVYNLETFDKQEGTDPNGGSYWYQRCINQGMYNKGQTIVVDATKSTLNYVMDKKNMYWPIPEREINANNKAKLWQNFGYANYDESVQVWDNYEDAIADQDNF